MQKTTAELIGEFEQDVNNVKDNVMMAASRSEAGRQLIEGGISALREIVQHLRRNMPARRSRIEDGWRMLVRWFSTRDDFDSEPRTGGGLKDVLKWAAEVCGIETAALAA